MAGSGLSELKWASDLKGGCGGAAAGGALLRCMRRPAR